MNTRLEKAYKILQIGINNTYTHEFIVDLRSFKVGGLEAEDVAKRLIDKKQINIGQLLSSINRQLVIEI